VSPKRGLINVYKAITKAEFESDHIFFADAEGSQLRAIFAKIGAAA
jgi:hypothetical protein